MTRQETIHAIQQNPDVSVLIIGGGINGIGTFRDLAMQGVDVLLVEMRDFSSGASAASSHMAHGGLRYLENGEFHLVYEALKERNRLLQNAPHGVKPAPTTIPIFSYLSGTLNAPLKFIGLRDKPSQRGALVIKAGLMMYDLFTLGQQTLPRHRFFSRTESLAKRPALNPDILFTAQYYDAWIPYPERIALELVLDAEAESPQARALNYVKAISAGKDTITLQDALTGETFDVKPKVVVNAAGPWIDFTNEALNRPSNFIGGTKGSHIVVDHPALHAACQGNEMFFENEDGRITLFFPLEDRVLIGTTDIPIVDPDEAICTEEEVDYMLELVSVVFPKIVVTRDQIVFRFSGVRPLPTSDADTPGQISRNHSIKVIEAGLRGDYPVLSMVSGKWTTYRAFSEQTTDAALERLGKLRRGSTAQVAIGGGRNYPGHRRETWLAEQQTTTGYSRERLENLMNRYGSRAMDVIAYCEAGKDAPLDSVPEYTQREIMFLAEQEKVIHLEDLLLRRTLLAMLGKVTEESINEIAKAAAKPLGWKAADIKAEVKATMTRLIEAHGMHL